MNLLKLSSYQPRFGWQQGVHHTIDTGAINKLKSSWFQDYLKQQLPQIQQYDDAQDRFVKGPGHYVDLEKRDNREASLPVNAQTWQTLQSTFQSATQHLWRQTPLTEERLPAGPSVYYSILGSYQALKTLLNTLKMQTVPLTDLQRNQINQTVGQLAHYVGDLFMPLHTTAFYNWPLSSQQPKSMHDFIDGDVLTSDECSQLAQGNNTLPALALNALTLKPFLLDAIHQSHLKIWDIVACHHQLLALPGLVQNPQLLETHLRMQLKPLIVNQVLQAQQALSAILNLAWQSAV